jgi:hypothetical protein
VGLLAGPYVGAAVLLALGGFFKLRRPAPTARALREAGLSALAPLARGLGAAEVVVGVGTLVVAGPVAPALVAAFYVAFAGFVGLRLGRHSAGEGVGEGAGGCGCFGAAEGPPHAVHLVMNLAAAGVAAAVAAGSGGGLAAALRGQPLAGVPFLLLVAVLTGLAYAALTILPRTLEALRP